MTKHDWYGLGISLFSHTLLLLVFAFLTMAAAEEQPFGYIEVDFGPIAEGRPVRRAVETRPEAPSRSEETRVQPETKPAAAPPREAKPVDLPDQETPVEDVETVEAPETEVISPEPQNTRSEESEPDPVPEQQEAEPANGGASDGSTGSAEGADGPGTEETKSAPYNIEGLNRRPTHTRLPAYSEKVNATIRVRITVDPSGRIVRRIPLMKANPSLEQAVMNALQYWRFNPLPPNAPQTDQTGTITFRFRLE